MKTIIRAALSMVILISMIGCAQTPVAQAPVEAPQPPSVENKQEDSVSFVVEIPRDNLVIAPGRDFYVLGNIEGDLPDDAKVSVSLVRNSDSETVRTVYSTQKANKDGLYVNYPWITFYTIGNAEMLRDSLMPDIVYDPPNFDTFKDQWRKLYYDDYNFTATLYGGDFTFDVNPNDENGKPFEVLTPGEYTIVISAETSTGERLGRTEFDITINVNEEKIMSRFSPQEHMDVVAEIANENGYTIYLDPFSGLFNVADFLVNFADPALNIRINRKWHYMEMIEYREGLVHFFIYNVDPTSTTWSVETGAIQETKSIDDPERLQCYYYDIGDITVGSVTGKFKQFVQDDRLQLTRVDYLDENSVENVLDVATLDEVTSDFDVMDGVAVSTGDVMALYGVLKPIQVDEADLIFDETESDFQILNRISHIQYHITGDNVDYSTTKEIELYRTFPYGGTGRSQLEFKHDFLIDEAWANKTLTFSLTGYDRHGNLISGTTEEFQVTVSSAAELQAAA